MSRTLVLAAIRFYRRWLSPRKGFRCAAGLRTGRDSCSDFGLRAFRKAGVWRGLWLMQRQFDRCAVAAAGLRRHTDADAAAGRTLRWGQRGILDCGADCGPDCGDFDCGDALDVADCGCDLGNSRSRADRSRRCCRRDSRCCPGGGRRREEAALERALARQRERRARAAAGPAHGLDPQGKPRP